MNLAQLFWKNTALLHSTGRCDTNKVHGCLFFPHLLCRKAVKPFGFSDL